MSSLHPSVDGPGMSFSSDNTWPQASQRCCGTGNSCHNHENNFQESGIPFQASAFDTSNGGFSSPTFVDTLLLKICQCFSLSKCINYTTLSLKNQPCHQLNLCQLDSLQKSFWSYFSLSSHACGGSHCARGSRSWHRFYDTAKSAIVLHLLLRFFPDACKINLPHIPTQRQFERWNVRGKFLQHSQSPQLDFMHHVSFASFSSEENQIWPTLILMNYTSFYNFLVEDLLNQFLFSYKVDFWNLC